MNGSTRFRCYFDSARSIINNHFRVAIDIVCQAMLHFIPWTTKEIHKTQLTASTPRKASIGITVYLIYLISFVLIT